jgi:uncharacterized protein YciI
MRGGLVDADPVDGTRWIFPSREAAERFVHGDPCVVNGLVAEPKIRDWNPLIFDI